MPSLTPQRVRLTLIQKVKIIEESKKFAFDRKKISNEFGISQALLKLVKSYFTSIVKFIGHRNP